MRTFLIIYSSTNSITELQARIRSLGEAFFFMDTHCLLSVDDHFTAQDIYNRLGEDSQLNSIFVNAISTTVSEGYWGTMPRDFWDWLKAHPTSR